MGRFNKRSRPIDLTRALYSARRINKSQYVFFLSSRIENVHHKRSSAGKFERLEAVSKKIEEVEKAHGLREGHYWLRDEGPKEWKKLNIKFTEVSDQYFYDLLIEFDLQDIAELWKTNRKEYDKLREKGRRAVHHMDEKVDALREIVACYGREARLAASAQAYSAAVTLLGAGLEGILLLRCLKSEQKAIRIAKTLYKPGKMRFVDEPVKWTFDNLNEVCLKAGWLPAFDSSVATFKTSGLAHLLREMRNLVHPGRIIRERPWSELGENEYKFCEAIFVTVLSILSKRKPIMFGGAVTTHNQNEI